MVFSKDCKMKSHSFVGLFVSLIGTIGLIYIKFRMSMGYYFRKCFLNHCEASDLLRRERQWQYYYSVQRPYFSYRMDGLTPTAQLRQLRLDLTHDFENFPVMILG